VKLPTPPSFSDPGLQEHFLRIQQELEQMAKRTWYLDRDVEHPHSLTVRSNFQLADSTAVTSILDEDALSSNSATALATQQSIKAYVDSVSGASALNDLSDVTLTSPASANVLRYSGSAWVNATLADAGISATGHSHAISDVTGLQTALDAKAASSHTHAFSALTSKPTTLAGYGITDAAASSHNHTLDSLSNVTVSSNSAGELLTWSGSAWINETLAEAGISAVGHAHAFSEITSKPTTLSGYGITDAAASSHTHAFSAITSKPTTLSGYGITDAAASSHTHGAADVSAGTFASGNFVFQGNLTVDTSTLFVDSSANEVGVGTVTPAHKLDVTGDIGVNGYRAIQQSRYGYSASYKSLIIGQAGTTNISLGVDTNATGLTGSSFSSGGQVVVPAGGISLVNNAGTDFIGFMRRQASSDNIIIGPAMSSGMSSGPLTLSTTSAEIVGHFAVKESTTELADATTVTPDWDVSNQHQIDFDSSSATTTIDVNDEKMVAGGSYILLLQHQGGSGYTIAWQVNDDAVAPLLWVNGTPPVLGTATVGDITVVQFLKAMVSNRKRIIGSWYQVS
jgi:hypothetical protein